MDEPQGNLEYELSSLEWSVLQYEVGNLVDIENGERVTPRMAEDWRARIVAIRKQLWSEPLVG